eukprot:TRINITY_DN57714_c0_g1_i1.p1 TRINITY_DN57714_c0_g1~~TRINITY_DN57714_c0_g1_i1.p1  ORF type:complete len:137 (-),score=20.76 TRINITY_DN57714_c0_g1_i1:223-633(-)
MTMRCFMKSTSHTAELQNSAFSFLVIVTISFMASVSGVDVAVNGQSLGMQRRRFAREHVMLQTFAEKNRKDIPVSTVPIAQQEPPSETSESTCSKLATADNRSFASSEADYTEGSSRIQVKTTMRKVVLDLHDEYE